MSQLPTVEYSPMPEEGVVTTRVSADRTVITLHPSAAKMFRAFVGPAIGLVAAAGLYGIFWQVSDPRTRHVLGIAVFPGVFALLSLAAAVEKMIGLMNPIQFEVDGTSVSMRWRTLTQAKLQVWPREALLEVVAERIRIKGQLLKWSGLVIRHRELGKVVILRGARRELEVIARRLRAALRLPETEPLAMMIPPPPGCRFRRLRWGDGVAIAIPPRFQRTAYAIVIGTWCAAAIGVCAWLYTVSDRGTEQKWATVVLAIAVTGIGSAISIQALKKLRKSTGIASSPLTIQVEETGLVSPMNSRWNALEVKEIRVVPIEGTARGHLEIVAGNGPPVVLALRRRIVDLEWTTAVLQKGRAGSVEVKPGKVMVVSDVRENEMKEDGSGTGSDA